MKNFVMLFMMFFAASEHATSIPLTITIEEMNSFDGNIIVAVFIDNQSFQDDDPIKMFVFPKKDNLINGVFSCTIDLPEGKYGIAVHDDENADERMNYNFIGMPKEGFGFSNYYHEGISRPKYADFEFPLRNNIPSLKIKLRYL